MAAPPLSVLLIEPAPAAIAQRLQAAGLAVQCAPDAVALRGADAVLMAAPTAQDLAALLQRPDFATAALEAALLVLSPCATEADEAALFALGVEDLLTIDAPELVRAVRRAVLRKRHERATRLAYATDLATGLPHQAQLLEHMTHLLALREREPAPMVLLVAHITGVATAATQLGAEAGNVLRRKVAVRLRSGLRAGDVVAAVGPDTFAVLLGHLEAAADGARVAAKLVRSLQQPLMVAGRPCPLAVQIGQACYPADGKDARVLLQRATSQAVSLATVGADGVAWPVDHPVTTAANSEGPGGGSGGAGDATDDVRS